MTGHKVTSVVRGHGIQEIAPLITTITLIAALLVGYQQLREAQATRKTAALLELLNTWESQEQRAGRRFVTRIEADALADPQALRPEDRDQVDSVVLLCNRVAYATNNGLVPLGDSLELFGPGMLRVWQKMGPLVEQRRRAGDTRYLSHFESYITRYRSEIPVALPTSAQAQN